jgi:uncharacterized RDD family membrane protein YckC
VEKDVYAVVVPVGAPTVPPPRLPPILIPGSLVPVQLASRWKRAIALVLDGVPFLFLAYVVAVAVQGGRIRSAIWPGVFTKNFDTKSLGLPAVSLTHPLALPQLEGLLAFSGAMLAVYALWTAYRVVLITTTGCTAGKWLLRIAVVDAADPRRHPSVGQAVRRCLVPQGAGLVPIPFTGVVPYLWAFKDPKNQGLHDRAANTLVVSRPRR